MMISLLAQAAQAATQVQGNEAYVIWALLLLGAALILLVVEVFVPSGGLIGILCGIAAIGSVAAFWKYDPLWGMVSAALYVLMAPIVLIFVFKLWLHSPVAKMMILGGTVGDEDAEDATISSEHARHERFAQLRELIGLKGVTITVLRPVGTVRIDGRRIDAMAETGVIEANTPIVVTDVYDNQIKVRPE